MPFTFAPDPMGGTEVYVRNLALEQAAGLESLIAAPGEQDEEYRVDGLPVFRFATSKRPGLRALYGEGDPAAAASFSQLLDRLSPDLVHLHAFTPAVSVAMEASKRRRLPVVVTYHTPTVTCMRGTLLEKGTSVCDGLMDERRCGSCALEARGVPGLVRAVAGALPAAAGKLAGRCGLDRGVWIGARMTELTEVRLKNTRLFLERADAIVVPCRWSEQLLLRNGVPRERIVFSRQGLNARAPVRQRSAGTGPGTPLRIVFLGRLDVAKGLETVLAALRELPGEAVALDIYAVHQGNRSGGNSYVAAIEKAIAEDARVRLLPPVPADVAAGLLADYDVLVAPSRLLETGPLVVLEAHAARVPVIGSNLGGIAELVTHERDGLLVEPGNAKAWAAAIRRLMGEPGLYCRLAEGISPPKGMSEVAREMNELYCGLAPAGMRAVSGRIVPVQHV
ncbi:MAG: glycosyltransferase [Bryobacteraceae bacterium]|nr:glycosyltransferase [Bryobacteraceae bacterium]